MPQSTYYKNSRMTPALERARKAYLVPNILTGVCIFSFVIGVYAYTIKAVAQDEFEDVPVPDGPAPSAAAPHHTMTQSAGRTSVGVTQETKL
jgi:cytochrome c oxidase assembly factor 3